MLLGGGGGGGVGLSGAELGAHLGAVGARGRGVSPAAGPS